ncbi:MAG: ABC transporter ATP-binding protein [Gemmataceae bacterium]|nr:ABC transporter ATP-binding protein [Gemmataceae bacterium]
MPPTNTGRIFFFRSFRIGWKTNSLRAGLFLASLAAYISAFALLVASWAIFNLTVIIPGPLATSVDGSQLILFFSESGNLPKEPTGVELLFGLASLGQSPLAPLYEMLANLEKSTGPWGKGNKDSLGFLAAGVFSFLLLLIAAGWVIQKVSWQLALGTARQTGALHFSKLKLFPHLPSGQKQENPLALLEKVAQGGFQYLGANQTSGLYFILIFLTGIITFPSLTLMALGFLGLGFAFTNWIQGSTAWSNRTSQEHNRALQLEKGAVFAELSGSISLWNREVKSYLTGFAFSQNLFGPKKKLLLVSGFAATGAALIHFSRYSPSTFFAFEHFSCFLLLLAGGVISGAYWAHSIKEIEKGVAAVGLLLNSPGELPLRESQENDLVSFPAFSTLHLDQFSLILPGGKLLIEPFSLVLPKNRVTVFCGLAQEAFPLLALTLAGKSHPSQGEIRLDQVNLRRIPPKDLAANIGMVTQDGGLLPGSVLENLTGGNLYYDLHQVLNTAREIKLHKQVGLLPKSYATLLSKGTLKPAAAFLLGLGRVILQGKKIILAKDPDVTLSTFEEDLLQDALQLVSRETVTLIESGRPKMLEKAGWIAFFHQGQLVAEGTHQTLLQTNQTYQGYFHFLAANPPPSIWPEWEQYSLGARAP